MNLPSCRFCRIFLLELIVLKMKETGSFDGILLKAVGQVKLFVFLISSGDPHGGFNLRLRKLARMRGENFRPRRIRQGIPCQRLFVYSNRDIQGRIRRARGERQPCFPVRRPKLPMSRLPDKIAHKISLFLNLFAFSSRMLLENTRPDKE